MNKTLMSNQIKNLLNTEERKTVHILWSGGWDGSFRMIQLSQYNINIQPYYIVDPERKSVEYEKKAMLSIVGDLSNRFNSHILPIIYYDKDFILTKFANKDVSKSFQYLHKKYRIGTQYEWFALLTRHLGTKMESAVVHQYHGKVENAINGESSLKILTDNILPERYIIDTNNNNKYISDIFENIIFPLIKFTKKDEETVARKSKWIDILEKSWFCHSPINGKPCGICTPCDDAMNTGMEWRIPEEAKKRYYYKKSHKRKGKIYKILSFIYKYIKLFYKNDNK